MADNEAKSMPGAWQNTPSRTDSQQSPAVPNNPTVSTSQDSSPAPHQQDDARSNPVYSMTDVTPAIRRIRQLRDEVLLEKRGTSPRDGRHQELEQRLLSLESEEQEVLRREEKERQTDEFMKKTLEEERLLRGGAQHHPPSMILPTWQERMELAEAHKASDTVVHQPHPSAEGQAIMATLTQLSKDLTSNQQQLFMQMNHLGSHLEQIKGQVGQLSSRVDNIEASSIRSRSRSGSRHSSQHRAVASESVKLRGLPTTVELVYHETMSHPLSRDIHLQHGPIEYHALTAL